MTFEERGNYVIGKSLTGYVIVMREEDFVRPTKAQEVVVRTGKDYAICLDDSHVDQAIEHLEKKGEAP